MNVLVVDSEAMGLDFCIRCAAHGHDVRWYRYSTKPARDGEGFEGFKIVQDWRPHMQWARDGLIFTTGNWRFIHELDRYRDYGFKVFGPSVKSAMLEIDRGAGMDALQSVGIEVPPYQEFDGLQSALKFARKSDRAWVFKPLGDETDKALTYVSRDPADLVGWLERQIGRGKQLNRCMLQEKIDMLCELGVSGWMGPDGFLPERWQVCVEHKKLMDGEIGPATGEQGTVCQYVEVDKLAEEMLVPMEPILRSLGHRGDFAIGAGIDKSGRAWPFEFTARAGWPAFFIQTASHRGDSAKWMRDLLDGKDSLRVSYDVAIGVVLSQPRYPYQSSPADLIEGNPIAGLDEVYENVHCVSVMRGKGPKMGKGGIEDAKVYQTSGEYVLVATALGKTVERARDKVYRTVDQIHFPDMMYRTDIGEKVQKVLPQLHRHGYLKDMTA
jgi:phosphoribosylamine--glycine ligase